MAWSGGVYSRFNGQFNGPLIWTEDRDAAILIEASRHDTHDQDIADGITACLNKNGQNAMAAPLNMGSNKATNLAAGTAGGDAVNFTQLSTKLDESASITAVGWDGTTLNLTRSDGDLSDDIKLMSDLKSGGKIRHNLDVHASAASVTIDTTSASRHQLICNEAISLTISKQAGDDAELGTSYQIEGNILVENGATPSNITIVGAGAGEIKGSQDLNANAVYVLSYIIQRTSGDNYKEIYVWGS